MCHPLLDTILINADIDVVQIKEQKFDMSNSEQGANNLPNYGLRYENNHNTLTIKWNRLIYWKTFFYELNVT